ncbi:MAG: molybdopterin-dependent oxidoreductase [Actinobacteria bacterium]|nr:molybdopterin-dependent oxidoreductase [Actinomycetota bacterium]
MIRKKIFLNIIFILIIIFLLSSIASGCLKNEENVKSAISTGNEAAGSTSVQTSETHASSSATGTNGSATEGTNYLDLYEGLHITGTPIDVDINTYSLKITGSVDKELSFTFDEIKNMKSVREEIVLICPGYFADKGFWTGVKVIDLLKLAGVKSEAKKVEFISIDGSYSQTLPIEKLSNDGFLIAYQFNDKEFSRYHGYPLRLVAKDEPGSTWVKWLGEIKVKA